MFQLPKTISQLSPELGEVAGHLASNHEGLIKKRAQLGDVRARRAVLVHAAEAAAEAAGGDPLKALKSLGDTIAERRLLEDQEAHLRAEVDELERFDKTIDKQARQLVAAHVAPLFHKEAAAVEKQLETIKTKLTAAAAALAPDIVKVLTAINGTDNKAGVNQLADWARVFGYAPFGTSPGDWIDQVAREAGRALAVAAAGLNGK